MFEERRCNFKIEYVGPGPSGEKVKDQGWRVYRASYHTHRKGQEIRRSRSRQIPRWKLIGVFETELEAETCISDIIG